jgi:hypothetical protein
MSILITTLNLEVLQVLSANNSVWDRCCGPNGNGLTSESLLTNLQIRFPTSNWTADLLSYILSLGQRQGRIKQLPNNVYYLNTTMILVNPTNAIYQSASSAICNIPSGCACNNTTLV